MCKTKSQTSTVYYYHDKKRILEPYYYMPTQADDDIYFYFFLLLFYIIFIILHIVIRNVVYAAAVETYRGHGMVYTSVNAYTLVDKRPRMSSVYATATGTTTMLNGRNLNRRQKKYYNIIIS